jgi:hypothetical protein
MRVLACPASLNGVLTAVEAAEAIPLDAQRLDPLAASSRGLGELIAAVGGRGSSSSASMGPRRRRRCWVPEVVRELPAPTRVASDVRSPLADAARVLPRSGRVAGGGAGDPARVADDLVAGGEALAWSRSL